MTLREAIALALVLIGVIVAAWGAWSLAPELAAMVVGTALFVVGVAIGSE